MRRAVFALLLAFALASPGAATPALAQSAQVDARAEVAAALFAASATQAAELRNMDDRLRQAHTEIERLQARGQSARAELIAAQERYVTNLASRDRAYSQEIAVLRAAVIDIASTPEGAGALARFNAGDEIGALVVLDQMVEARASARQVRVNIETAAERRRVAELALEARARGRLDTNAVTARYEEVTRLDPNVHWDWIELTRLYVDAGQLADARRSASRALELASNPRERSTALIDLGDVLSALGEDSGARARYEEALSIDRAISASNSALDEDMRRDLSIALSRLGDVSLGLGDADAAVLYYRESLQRDYQLSRTAPSQIAFQDICTDLNDITDAFVAQGELSAARQHIEVGVGLCQQLVNDFGDNDSLLQLAYGRWRLANIRAVQGDTAFAANEFRALRAFADDAIGADSSNNRLAIQALVLEISFADIEILTHDHESARRRLNQLMSALSRARETSEFDDIINSYVWLAQVRLAAMPGANMSWSMLEPGWPRVRALSDLSALDMLFIERARAAGAGDH
jgi:tetratricopeptide (TPR) repeat protein